ncbi:MAG: hypothetical protein WCR51_02540 [Planctomycetia bacterium]
MAGLRTSREPLVANLVTTAFMVGLIWFVQIVHYPLMAGWPHDEFGAWEARHRERTGPVVVPAMLAEGAAAAWLVLRRPVGVPAWLPWVAGLLLLGVWASTFLLQVPCHERLSEGWDAAVHARLVATNWLRTLLWSLRLGLLVGAAVASRSIVQPG